MRTHILTFKKARFTAATVMALLLSTAAYADNGYGYDNKADAAGSGVYLGGFGGYSWGDADTTAGNAEVEGGDYGAFVGYELGHFLDGNNFMGLYGAVEGYYTWSDADGSVGGIDLEKDHEWGVNFRPGFTFVDRYSPFGIKPYGIIGYRQTKFEATALGVTEDETYNGFELGLGTELLAYQDFGVRVDYTHVFYGEKDGIDPDEDNVRVGVAYHF